MRVLLVVLVFAFAGLLAVDLQRPRTGLGSRRIVVMPHVKKIIRCDEGIEQFDRSLQILRSARTDDQPLFTPDR